MSFIFFCLFQDEAFTCKSSLLFFVHEAGDLDPPGTAGRAGEAPQATTSTCAANESTAAAQPVGGPHAGSAAEFSTPWNQMELEIIYEIIRNNMK